MTHSGSNNAVRHELATSSANTEVHKSVRGLSGVMWASKIPARAQSRIGLVVDRGSSSRGSTMVTAGVVRLRATATTVVRVLSGYRRGREPRNGACANIKARASPADQFVDVRMAGLGRRVGGQGSAATAFAGDLGLRRRAVARWRGSACMRDDGRETRGQPSIEACADPVEWWMREQRGSQGHVAGAFSWSM